MKKFCVILSFAILSFAFSVTAFAGSIIIDNANEGEACSAYKIMSIKKIDRDENIYFYSISEEWGDFMDEAKSYFNTDADGYITSWVEDANKDEFAKRAIMYAVSRDVSPTQFMTVESNMNRVEFSNLSAGFYLIVDSAGSYSLQTTTLDPVDSVLLSEIDDGFQNASEGSEKAISLILEKENATQTKLQEPQEGNPGIKITVVVFLTVAVIWCSAIGLVRFEKKKNKEQ